MMHFNIFRAAVCALVVLTTSVSHANDLGSLNDEFDQATSLSDWQRIHVVEQWFADQLEILDINATQAGRMVMMPYTVTWYQNYRGPLVFKEVSGDYVVTTSVHTTGRDGVSVPSASFSLAGIMIRRPRGITPATWTPGGEDYIFLSVGRGNSNPHDWQFEVKTTDDSASTLFLSPSPSPMATIQIARLGEYVITLRRQLGENWQIHRRFHRDDFPAQMQVGLVAYTDYGKVSIFDPLVHNSNVLNPPLPTGVTDPNPGVNYNPDLIADFDYARFYRPNLPAELVGVDLANETLVPDSALLAFLGDHANVQCGSVFGDVDCDGERTVADLPALVDCLAGPDTTPAPSGPDQDAAACLAAFDSDDDADVDSRDFIRWQR